MFDEDDNRDILYYINHAIFSEIINEFLFMLVMITGVNPIDIFMKK